MKDLFTFNSISCTLNEDFKTVGNLSEKAVVEIIRQYFCVNSSNYQKS